MKILFLCGSLEPGKDGVGDYCRRLSDELIAENQEAGIIALYDRFIQTPTVTEQSVAMLRLPAKQPISEKIRSVAAWIEKEQPDVISLQYVPYSYSKKGLPFKLASMIKKISGNRKVHIMFHELWQGEAAESSAKEKLLGQLQIYISRQLAKVSSFEEVFTNTLFYHDCLEREKIKTKLVPVFSNIPLSSGNLSLINWLPEEIKQKRTNYIIGCLFGAVHYYSRLAEKFLLLQKLVNALNKRLFVIHVGKGNLTEDVTQTFSINDIGYSVLGEHSGDEIAGLFTQMDIGISTYPKILYQKSGSIAAMLNNGLPVVLLRKSFAEDARIIDEVVEVEKIISLDVFIHQPKLFSFRYGVKYSANEYRLLCRS